MEKPNTQKQIPFNYLLITGLVLSLLGIGYLGYSNFQLKQKVDKLQEQIVISQPTFSPIPTPLPANDIVTLPIVNSDSPVQTEPDVAAPSPIKPANWIAHKFATQNLTVYTPPQWKSSLEDFPNVPSTLLRFWESGTPNNATIQLNITQNWNNMGIGPNYSYFEVTEGIRAYRVDPPKMEQQKLDRYQTNFYFERKGKGYTLLCVHNWMEKNIATCETLLQTLEFSN